MTLSRADLAGGPHDGESIIHPPATPLPENLVSISFDDGAVYARIGEEIDAASGQRALLLHHDPDGSLTRSAKATFG